MRPTAPAHPTPDVAFCREIGADAVVDYKADSDEPFSIATLASGSLSTQFSGMVHVPMGRAATGRLLMSSGNTLIQQRGRRVIRPVYETETVYP